MQLAQDISSRMYVKKRRRSGLRRGFLTYIIGGIDKSRCVSYFSTDPKEQFLTNKTINEKERIIMTTVALHTYSQNKQKKESILDRFLNYYRENSVDIICGLLSLNGSANVCSIYRSLTK